MDRISPHIPECVCRSPSCLLLHLPNPVAESMAENHQGKAGVWLLRGPVSSVLAQPREVFPSGATFISQGRALPRNASLYVRSRRADSDHIQTWAHRREKDLGGGWGFIIVLPGPRPGGCVQRTEVRNLRRKPSSINVTY